MTLPVPPHWLAEGSARRVLDVLSTPGEEARPVGGAVRNWLLGLEPGDIDIATTHPPDQVVRLVEQARFKAVPTGIEHGTITVVVNGEGFEVTTLREDVASDGRHAIVRFGRDWRGDAARRDFTINAMSLSLDGTLHDFFGGAEDLHARRVRFIGDAVSRIREDRLRILRFFRFHASYGAGEPDREAIAACIAERQGLDDLSRERIRAEFLKLLVARGVGDTLQVMSDAGLLGRVLGGVPLAAHVRRIAEIEAASNVEPDAARRLGVLGVLVREDAERLRGRLALSNAEFRRLDSIGAGWAMIDPKHGDAAIKAALYLAGPRGFADRAFVAFARSGAPVDDPAWQALISLPARWKAPVFPVTGDDLMRRGVPEGPELGRVLSLIREAWIAADFPVGRAAINSLIEHALHSTRL